MLFKQICEATLLSSIGLSTLAAAQTCIPEDFGGAADGATLNTTAIQQAIDKCSAAGGGEVRLGPGVWLSGPINLKSNVVLNLMQGSVLKADNRNNDFVAAYIGSPAQPNEAFLLANQVENVIITGRGVIDGSGDLYWWDDAIELRRQVRAGNEAAFAERFPGVKLANGMPRPWLIEANEVKGLMIYGVELKNSPMWNIVLRNSQYLGIKDIKITAPLESPNTDGIDVVSSQHVFIRNVEIYTGDDNVAIKSGVNQDGAAPSDDIVIEDSLMHAGHGVSVGSETANGIGKVSVRNLTFDATENGVRIKSARDRGNKIGPLYVENVKMDKVQTPILVTCSYAGQSGAAGLGLVDPIESAEVTSFTPYIRGVYIKDLTAQGAEIAALLSGLPESEVKDVRFENVKIDSRLGIQARYVQGEFTNVEVNCTEGDPVAQGPQTDIKQ